MDLEGVITSKPTWKLKHANSILETFEYFCQISSKSIHIISSYTVSKLGRFLRHSVVITTVSDRSDCEYLLLDLKMHCNKFITDTILNTVCNIHLYAHFYCGKWNAKYLYTVLNSENTDSFYFKWTICQKILSSHLAKFSVYITFLWHCLIISDEATATNY